MDFAVLEGGPQSENERKGKDKYLDLGRKLKQLWNTKVAVMIIVVGTLGTVAKRLGKKSGGIEDQEYKEYPGHSIVKKSPEKTCCYTDSSERPLTLVWKTHKE